MNSRSIITCIVFVLMYSNGFTQVGVGNTDPQATLDISASNTSTPANNDGILIPRVANFPTTDPTATQDGLMIFYTGTSRSGKGFYFWDETITDWVFLSGAKAIDDLDDGKTENGSIFLGDNVANSVTASAFGNVGIGEIAFRYLTDGDFNVAIGPSASENLRTGNNNISIGLSAMYRNRTGDDNIAIGNYTGFNSDIATSGNIFIGNWAGFSESSGGHKLYIENSTANSNNALIYGEFDNDILRVNGALQVNNPSSNGYVFPSIDGSANQVLQTDGNGQISFVDPSTLFNADVDWYEVGSASAPDDINDNLFTQGNVGIGEATPSARLHVNDGTTPLLLDISGTQRFRFSNNALEFLNNGASVFVGEFAGRSDDLTSNQNTAIGYRALRDNVTGTRNIAIGSGAMLVSTGGTANVAIGDDSMAVSSSGSGNVAVGTQTLFRNTTGDNNVALGGTALRENTTGLYNVALGYRALYNTSANANVGIGFETGFTNSSGIRNTFVGTGAGHLTTGGSNLFLGYHAGYNETGSNKLYISNSNTSNPLIYGEFDNDILRTNGELQVGDPSGAGYAFPISDGAAGEVLVTDGFGQLSYTDVSSLISADSDWTEVGANIERQSGNVYIGDTNATDNDLYISDRIIDWDNSTYYLDPDDVSRLGEIQIDNGTTASPSLYFGSDATTGIAGGVNVLRIVTSGSANHTFTNRGQLEFNYRQSVLLGNNAGDNLSASFNDAVFIGEDAGQETTSGRGNIALGRSALNDNTTGGHNIAMGSYTMALNNGSSNISIGGSSFRFLNSGSNNVAVGDRTGFRDFNSSNNTYIGYQAGGSDSTTNYNRTGNVFIGYQSGFNRNVNNQLYIENSDAASPLIYGEFDNDIVRINGEFQIGNPTTTGFALPTNRGTANQVLTTAGDGSTSWTSISGGASQINDLSDGVTNSNSIFVGANSGMNDDGNFNQNTGFGNGALQQNTSGSQNTGIGYNALNANLGGIANTATGDSSLNSNTSGTGNTAFGTFSLYSNTTGSGNTAIGWNALQNTSSGGSNVAIGDWSGRNTNGSGNVIVGSFALEQNSAGSNNVAIGNNTASSSYNASGSVFIGNSAGGNETNGNRLYIENSGSDNTSALIYGEFDNDRLRFNDQVGIGRTAATNALEVEGQASKTSPGAFVANSDKRLKKNIESISGGFALQKISQLKGVTYQWNDTQTGTKRPEGIQYGFIAQDIQKVFPEKVTEDNLGFLQTAYGDYDPIVIEAIKALHEKIKILETENNNLKSKLNQLESLEKRLLSLEQKNNSPTH